MSFTAQSIDKQYGGVHALTGVDFEVRPGEVHALLGANGAGKSTLVKILVGAEHPTSGTLTLDGDPVAFDNVREASRKGVAIVSQELTLFPDLDVLENLFIQREPRRLGVMDRAQMRALAEPVLRSLGVELDLGRRVQGLPLAQRQIVEIARALIGNPRIVLLDEPTSALAAGESRRLLEIVQRLRTSGVGVVFVSHHLEDVFSIADVVTVLRNGRVVMRRRPRAEVTISDVVDHMLGPADVEYAAARSIEASARLADLPRPEGPLCFEDVTIRGALRNFYAKVQPGEIVGLAGLEGSGAQAALRAVMGLQRISSGRIRLPDGSDQPRSVLSAVRSAIAYVPSDRKRTGLMLDDEVAENVAMVASGVLGRWGIFPSRRRMLRRAEEWRDRLGIRLSSVRARAGSLSGGNQQKVVLAKWLEARPNVILLDDPTRGVDVVAKAEIQALVKELASSGAIILYSSNDFEEMAAVCDRVIVLFKGECRGELNAELVSEHLLLEAVGTGIIPIR